MLSLCVRWILLDSLRSIEQKVQKKLLQCDLPKLIQSLRQEAEQDLQAATGQEYLESSEHIQLW